MSARARRRTFRSRSPSRLFDPTHPGPARSRSRLSRARLRPSRSRSPSRLFDSCTLRRTRSRLPFTTPRSRARCDAVDLARSFTIPQSTRPATLSISLAPSRLSDPPHATTLSISLALHDSPIPRMPRPSRSRSPFATLRSHACHDPLDLARPSRRSEPTHATTHPISLAPSRLFNPAHAATHSMSFLPSRLFDPTTRSISRIFSFLDSRASVSLTLAMHSMLKETLRHSGL
jgi:hypothetical protein